jgi:gentisate 1,2-dioxygenase
VLEGNGAYTTTDGERLWMEPGDLITTPSWTWHDHGKVTEGEMIWLDGIDVPLVNHLGLNFTEYSDGERQQELTVPDGESNWLYGSGFAPLQPVRTRPYSPVYTYPYRRAREALGQLAKAGRIDVCHGIKMRYVNPQNGGDIMPTLSAFLQLLPSGFATAAYRSTEASIYCVAEGNGRVKVSGEEFVLSRHDVFVVPNWTEVRFEADQDLVLFSFSDRAMQERLSLFRERRLEVAS